MLLPLDVVDVFTTFTFYIVTIIIILADVIANPYCGRSYCHLFCGRRCTTFILVAISLSLKWQMLLPIFVEDGKPHFIVILLADVIAMVADGMAT